MLSYRANKKLTVPICRLVSTKFVQYGMNQLLSLQDSFRTAIRLIIELYFFKCIIKQHHDKTNKVTIVPSEGTDQAGHEIFYSVCMEKVKKEF